MASSIARSFCAGSRFAVVAPDEKTILFRCDAAQKRTLTPSVICAARPPLDMVDLSGDQLDREELTHVLQSTAFASCALMQAVAIRRANAGG